jgi:hypothetical protein
MTEVSFGAAGAAGLLHVQERTNRFYVFLKAQISCGQTREPSRRGLPPGRRGLRHIVGIVGGGHVNHLADLSDREAAAPWRQRRPNAHEGERASLPAGMPVEAFPACIPPPLRAGTVF